VSISAKRTAPIKHIGVLSDGQSRQYPGWGFVYYVRLSFEIAGDCYDFQELP